MSVKMIAEFRRKPSLARQKAHAEQVRRGWPPRVWVAFDPGYPNGGSLVVLNEHGVCVQTMRL